ncbi:MAG TPA: diacylglycerol kinase family protein [Anaerolineales bacterium]|nr:diacylglycerol kinase family protein [Anaerolineales bacterium]
MRRALLLYNPAAGRFPIKTFVPSVLGPLQAAGWSVDVAETLSSSHATSVARQAAAENFHAVFAVGGDGTVGQVANGLVNTETALGVLPAGTMNVWAMELGLRLFEWPFGTDALADNARLLADAPVCRVDVGLCNDHAFLLWAGIGLDAMTIQQLEPRPRAEKYVSVPQYVAATMWTAAVWHGMDLRVWADDQQVDGHFLLAVAANIRRYVGGLAVLSPDAYLDDGQMDLWLISGRTLADALRAFFEVMAGSHVTSEQARRLPFRSARVESDTPFSIQMDGDPMLGSRQVEVRVQKQALKVLMPPQGAKLLKETAR